MSRWQPGFLSVSIVCLLSLTPGGAIAQQAGEQVAASGLAQGEPPCLRVVDAQAQKPLARCGLPQRGFKGCTVTNPKT